MTESVRHFTTTVIINELDYQLPITKIHKFRYTQILWHVRDRHRRLRCSSRRVSKVRRSKYKETATELSAYPIYTLLVIGLAETIQNQLFIETKFFCITEEDRHSAKEVRGIVDDFYFPCLRCGTKVNQDMVNVCDRAGVKEDLTTVPVMLSDISEVENPIPLTETSYLEIWLRYRQWLEPVILKYEAEGWTTSQRYTVPKLFWLPSERGLRISSENLLLCDNRSARPAVARGHWRWIFYNEWQGPRVIIDTQKWNMKSQIKTGLCKCEMNYVRKSITPLDDTSFLSEVLKVPRKEGTGTAHIAAQSRLH